MNQKLNKKKKKKNLSALWAQLFQGLHSEREIVCEIREIL